MKATVILPVASVIEPPHPHPQLMQLSVLRMTGWTLHAQMRLTRLILAHARTTLRLERTLVMNTSTAQATIRVCAIWLVS
jgi:hypothetical protein